MQNSLLLASLLISVQALAQPDQLRQTNTHFSHTLTTTARPETIWIIWTDVPNWSRWDDGLKTADLDGPFTVGTGGRLIPDKGPKSRFVITDLVPGQSYTFRTRLPLGSLYVKRFLTQQNGQTAFTHEVWFTGLTKGIFGRALGRNYRAILPDVLEKIKTLAETTPDRL